MTRTILETQTEAEIAYLLSHQAQREATEVIASFVADLRNLTDGDAYDFQRELAGEIASAETARADARRHLKRSAARKSTPDCPGPSWDVECVLYERIVRQFRTVGDAFAWKLFRFDRRLILACSQNDAPGPMTGKAGFGLELAAIMELHRSDGTFALLHGVTNCLRIGDLTVFEHDGPRLLEVKTSAATRGSRSRAQRHRLHRAVEAIFNGGHLGGAGEAELFVTSEPLKTRIGDLHRAVGQVKTDPTTAVAIGHQHVITAVNVLRATKSPTEPIAGAIADTDRLKRRAFSEASLDPSEHHLTASSFDAAGRDPALAPLAIFPLPPEEVALLTTDLISYETTVGWERLSQAFGRRGFIVTAPVDPIGGAFPAGARVLVAARGDRAVSINSDGIRQLLLELVDIDCYATAVSEYALADRTDERPSSAVLTFASENSVWR